MAKRKTTEDNSVLMKKVAYLIKREVTENVIAQRLKVSISTVSRLKKKAIDEQVLVFPDVVPKLNFSHHDYYLVSNLEQNDPEQPSPLKEFLNRHEVILIPVGELAAGSWEKTRKQFAALAAPEIRSILREVDSLVGVAWGFTLGEIAKHLEESQQEPLHTTKHIRVIPLSGDPFGHPHAHWTSSDLAVHFARVVGGEPLSENSGASVRSLATSLAGVPALLPRDFDGPELEILRRFVRSSAAYRDIFLGNSSEGVKPLISRLDAILTSVGSAEKAYGFSQDLLLKMANLQRDQLKDEIHGDIGGVILPKRDSELTRKLRGMWTGMNAEHLQDCRKRALREGKPGVVVATFGADKASVLIECVERQLVNRIIADADVFNEMAKLLEQRTQPASNASTKPMRRTQTRRRT